MCKYLRGRYSDYSVTNSFAKSKPKLRVLRFGAYVGCYMHSFYLVIVICALKSIILALRGLTIMFMTVYQPPVEQMGLPCLF